MVRKEMKKLRENEMKREKGEVGECVTNEVVVSLNEVEVRLMIRIRS